MRWIPKGLIQSRTVISLGDQYLKLVHAVGHGASWTVDAVLAHPIAGMSEEEILAWLKETGISKGLEPGAVLIANPSHLTTVRLFTLPSVNRNEIRDIVELQAEKHTPYAKEEILTDFLVVETDRSGYSRVLLVISHQDVVHRALRLVKEMGWPLERVGFELEGLVNWFRITQGSPPAGETLVAELDNDTTVLVILQRDKPYYHRSLALGARHLNADPAEGPAKLIAEFQRTLETFEAEGLNLKVSNVILTGLAPQFPGLAVSMQQGLDIPTVVVSPTGTTPLTEKAAQEMEALSQNSFASLLGLALQPSEVDLTPKALKLHRTFEVRSRALVQVGCQVIAGLLLLSCLVIGKAHQDERYRAWLHKEHDRLAGEARSMGFFMDQMKLVQEWLDSGDQFLESLMDLYKYTPATIQWDSLSFTKGQQLSLKGRSQEIPKVFDMVAQLQKLPRFSKVEAKRTTKKKVGDQDITEFEIVCTY